MFGKSILSVAGAALFTGASAQTAPGFPIPATQQLNVSYGNNTVSPPGERIPRPETLQPPAISSHVWFSSGSPDTDYGILLLVDLDVPRNGSRVQLLHWLATNVTNFHSNSTGNLTSHLIIPNEGAPAPYLPPNPPIGDVPHSYTFVLFPQPANFTVPSQYANVSNSRVPFNVSRFAMDAGLRAPLAGNWITVQNLSGSATATYPAARPTATSGGGSGSGNGTIQSSVAAMSFSMGGIALWTGLGTAVIAGFAAFAL